MQSQGHGEEVSLSLPGRIEGMHCDGGNAEKAANAKGEERETPIVTE